MPDGEAVSRRDGLAVRQNYHEDHLAPQSRTRIILSARYPVQFCHKAQPDKSPLNITTPCSSLEGAQKAHSCGDGEQIISITSNSGVQLVINSSNTTKNNRLSTNSKFYPKTENCSPAPQLCAFCTPPGYYRGVVLFKGDSSG